MGLLYGGVNFFLEISKKYSLGGDICTLGRQRILITKGQWLDICRENEITFNEMNYIEEFHSRWNSTHITADSFFKNAGFSSIESIDVSSYENASYLLDLNVENITSPLSNKYDLIFDGSTLEHIFNISTAMKNIARMAKIGGYILHISPCNGFVDDGFVQISPCFYEEFYFINGFDVVELLIHEFDVVISEDVKGKKVLETSDKLTRYSKEMYSSSMQKLQATITSGLCQVIVLARKVKEVSEYKYPYQGRYYEKSYWREAL